MELWDLYDENRVPLGRTHRRGDPLEPGTYHIVVGIWIINGKGEILTTLRHPDKLDYPGKWENTGGSILAGETSRQGAIRELYEETGVAAREDELTLLDSAREPTAFIDTYALRRDAAIGDLRMQEGETAGARWITLDELESLIAREDLALPIGRRFFEHREALVRLLPGGMESARPLSDA